jgi:hypothetical protein
MFQPFVARVRRLRKKNVAHSAFLTKKEKKRRQDLF